MSKINKLKQHLMDGKTVTGKQAWKWWGYYNLKDGVHKLRKRGLDIKTVMVTRADGTRYGKYYLRS